jgi:N,N'-diacetyllegionaminate synthase
MNTKIILEIGYNHEGSVTKAKQMIDEAVDLGVWAVKFQKWDYEGLPEWKKNEKKTGKHAYGKTYYEHRKKLELSIDELLELRQYAEMKGLIFVISGKDYNSIVELVENGFDIIKLPSQRYGDHDIFNYLMKRRKKLFILVSTGMRSGREILNSKWPVLADVVMHCISKYPARYEDCNFGWMRQNKFYNGYSSHEIDGEGIIPAILIGAKYIERHYTYDKGAKGSDHKISSDYHDMLKIMAEIEHIEKCIYPEHRNVSKEEQEVRDIYKRF